MILFSGSTEDKERFLLAKGKFLQTYRKLQEPVPVYNFDNFDLIARTITERSKMLSNFDTDFVRKYLLKEIQRDAGK